MKLSKIEIENFHSIDFMSLNIYDFTSLIGPNNCAKSTILRAIEILLNQKKPNKDEWRDLEHHRNIVISGQFDEIQDWEKDKPGVSGIVNDNSIRLRVTVSINEGKVETNYEAYIKMYDIDGFSERWGDLSEEVRAIANAEGFTSGTDWRGKANRQRVIDKIRVDHEGLLQLVDEGWTNENISIAPALKQAIPTAVIIPAIKDAQEIVKTTSTSVFGILLSRIIIPAVQEIEEYQQLEDVITRLSEKLSTDGEIQTISDLTTRISSRLNSLIEASIKITLSAPDTEKFLGSNTIIRMNDGTETPIELQGHGAQRALVFALIEELARIDSTVEGENDINKSTILLFEEPELFLHPHLMLRLKNALMSISQSDSWQVVISTHSPFLIDVVDKPESLIILNRVDNTTPPTKKQLESDPFNGLENAQDQKDALRASLNFHPTVNEAFFAKRVVLVEGDTEVALFNHEKGLHRIFNIDESKYLNTTIVSCGGKWTIVPYAKLLKKFDIPFRIIHDTDRKGRSAEELEHTINIDPYRANAKIADAAEGTPIHLVNDTMEHYLWRGEEEVVGKGKPFRAWKRINEIVNHDPSLTEFVELKGLFEFAFDW